MRKVPTRTYQTIAVNRGGYKYWELLMESNSPKAEAKKQIENERVTVTEWRFQPGAETGWHRHEYDYVVIPGMNGSLLLETTEEKHIVELKEGQSYFKPSGIEHNVINASDFEFYFVEIELR